MACPACNSTKNMLIKGQVFMCRKCFAIHGTVTLGESYEYVRPYMTAEAVPQERCRYFDFICLGSKGITRRHGWYDKRSKMIVQVG